MFTDFYRNLNEGKFVCIDCCQLQNGTPIVSIRNIPPYFQFGIYFNDSVILREYVFERKIALYRVIPFNEFHNNGKYKIKEYIPSMFSYDKGMTLKMAFSHDLKRMESEYCSALGDDFVVECMLGEAFLDYLESLNIGYHYTGRFRFVAALTHHAIGIGDGYIIHFDNDKKLKKPQIVLSRLDERNELGFLKYKFKPLLYEHDNILQRFCARNRAINIWASGKNFEGYHWYFRNCEHFVRWCKTGDKYSEQIKNGWIDLGVLVLSICTRNPMLVYQRNLKKYLFK